MNREAYWKKLQGSAGSFNGGNVLRDKERGVFVLIDSGESLEAVSAAMFGCFKLFAELENAGRLPFEHVERYGAGGELYFDSFRQRIDSAQQRVHARALSFS